MNGAAEQNTQQTANAGGAPALAWSGRRSVRLLAVLAVALSGVWGSSLLHRLAENRERASIEASFNQDAAARVHALAERVEAWQVAVRSLSAFYASSQEVERSEFAEFVRPILQACPGVRTIEWVPRVKRDQRDEHEGWPWNGKPEGYRIIERGDEGSLIVAGEREVYFPAAYIEPTGRPGAAIGFDHGSDPVRLAAMRAARDSGEIVSTAMTDLTAAGTPMRGVLVLAPVYKHRTAHETIDERRATLEGFVLASFVVDEVVERVLSDLPQSDIALYLFDDSATPDDQLLYASESAGTGASVTSAMQMRRVAARGMLAEKTIEFSGRRWRALCLPTQEFITARSTPGPATALTGGLVVTALLAGWLWAMFTRNQEMALSNLRLEREIAQRRAAAEQLLTHQESLRSLASELSMAEERERRRIATGLHDDLGQPLALAKMKLGQAAEAAAALVATPGEDNARNDGVVTLLADVRSLLDQVVQTTRSMTFELGSPILYELGLEAALESLVDRHRQTVGCDGEFEDDGVEKPLSMDVQVLVFQAVRELLINTAKHAGASRVKVAVSRQGGQVRVVVEDDGVGFDPAVVRPRGHDHGGYGLFNVRERLAHFNGSITIDSRPGQGTRVTLLVPVAPA